MPEKNQLTAILYGLAAIMQINETVLFWFIVVMGIDMVFGAVKSVVVPGLHFSMKAFLFGFMRKMALIVLILLVATLGKGLGFKDLESTITIIIRILMISEGISALYCFKSIWTKVEEKPNDFITKFITFIIKLLGKILQNLMKLLDDKTTCL
jgi:hypothetical protein